MHSEAKPHEISDRKARLKQLSSMDDAETDDTPQRLPSYQVGDYVKISKLSYYGEIISMNKDKVCVLANGMKMNTTLQEIEPAVKQVQKTKKKGFAKASVRSFSMECNVIGMRVAEALPIIDKYLDNAVLAKANNVRIIHAVSYTHLAQLSLQLDAKDIEFLIPFTRKLLAQLNKQYEIKHPSLAITRVVNAEYYVATGEKKQKNIVIAEEGQVDRSPCGTGTSAKLAYLHAKGNLSANEIFVNESFTGAKFYGRYEAEDVIGHYRGIQPMITGSAYITGKAVYVIDENDPLTYGFTI